MIKRTTTIHVELTPEELAFEFCNMNDTAHAKFFNEIFELTKKWDRPFPFQLQYIIDHPDLTDGGRHIMESIGDYGRN